MNKSSIIEQLQAYGVVAAHMNDNRVESVLGVPKKVVFDLPIFKTKSKFKVGDKIAILDSNHETAIICQVSKVETYGISKKPLLHLKGSKKIKLS